MKALQTDIIFGAPHKKIDFSLKEDYKEGHALVAQWIRRQPPKLKIAGSIPAGRTIKHHAIQTFHSHYQLSE